MRVRVFVLLVLMVLVLSSFHGKPFGPVFIYFFLIFICLPSFFKDIFHVALAASPEQRFLDSKILRCHYKIFNQAALRQILCSRKMFRSIQAKSLKQIRLSSHFENSFRKAEGSILLTFVSIIFKIQILSKRLQFQSNQL